MLRLPKVPEGVLARELVGHTTVGRGQSGSEVQGHTSPCRLQESYKNTRGQAEVHILGAHFVGIRFFAQ